MSLSFSQDVNTRTTKCEGISTCKFRNDHFKSRAVILNRHMFFQTLVQIIIITLCGLFITATDSYPTIYTKSFNLLLSTSEFTQMMLLLSKVYPRPISLPTHSAILHTPAPLWPPPGRVCEGGDSSHDRRGRDGRVATSEKTQMYIKT